MLKNNLLKSALISVLLLSQPAFASQALLRQFLAEVTTLQAMFEQQVTDETGFVLQSSAGKMYLSRPGQFRWDYYQPPLDDSSQPTLTQQILADGTFLYLYDPELEQATQRSLQDALGQVPSLLLVQSAANIDSHFEVIDIGVTDGLSWVALKPKASDASYQELLIAFEQDKLRSIELLDGLGNQTRLVLSQVQNNISLDAQTFDFVLPQGVDLLRE